MKHVIFICTGNICRSAMADGYLKMKIKQLGLEDKVTVDSAGTHAVSGENSTKFANLAIGEYGVELNGHVAKTLEQAKVRTADYLLVMTSRHKRDLINRYPELEQKVFLLKEYAGEQDYMDIDDPWGLSLDIYNSCAKEIVSCIDRFIEKELLK